MNSRWFEKKKKMSRFFVRLPAHFSFHAAVGTELWERSGLRLYRVANPTPPPKKKAHPGVEGCDASHFLPM